MKVRELKEVLDDFDPEMEVAVGVREGGREVPYGFSEDDIYELDFAWDGERERLLAIACPDLMSH